MVFDSKRLRRKVFWNVLVSWANVRVTLRRPSDARREFAGEGARATLGSVLERVELLQTLFLFLLA